LSQAAESLTQAATALGFHLTGLSLTSTMRHLCILCRNK